MEPRTNAALPPDLDPVPFLAFRRCSITRPTVPVVPAPLPSGLTAPPASTSGKRRLRLHGVPATLSALATLLAASTAAAAEPTNASDRERIAPTSLVSAAPLPSSGYSAAAHDHLIERLRRNDIDRDTALAQLSAWAIRPADRQARRRLMSDGVVIAWQAKQVNTVLRWAARPDELLDYALVPAYQAARTAPDRSLQGRIAAHMRRMQPDAWRPKIFEALWLADTHRYADAERTLDATAAMWTEPSVDQRIALLEARGALAEAREQPLQALGAYVSLTQLDPDHRYAAREGQFLTAEVSAPSAAAADAQAAEQARGDLFSTLELATFRQEALGQQLRWAIAERDQMKGRGAPRYAALDQLTPQFPVEIAAASAAGARARQKRDPNAEQWRDLELRLTYDYWTVLSERGRFQEIIEGYRAMHAQGITPPYYALSTVAGAYQQLRRSDLAVPLYEAAVAAGGRDLPVPSDTHVGLVYAYIDTARFEQAEALIAHLEAATPALLRLTPERGRPNPEYSDVRHLRALTQLYTDHPAQAARSFDALSSMAPMNAAFRAGQAETSRLRERPEAAVAHYEALLTDHPDDLGARAGYATALSGAGELRRAREVTEDLQDEAHESIATRNVVREYRALRAARLDVDAGFARDGGALANREWQTDTRLTSPLINDQWRLFAHQIYSRADIDPDQARLSRSGLGMQWTQGRWDLSGEAHHAGGDAGAHRNGVALTGAYRAGDQWRLSAGLDTNSANTPWRARRAGIGAREAEFGVGYVVNESRRFGLQYRHMDFSDGNLRQAIGVNWRERWITGPRVQVQTTLSAETGGNRERDTPYFSPARESAAELAVRAQYLTWKRDDRRLVQAVEASGGGYRQSGFGTDPLWSLRYAHEWDIGQTVQVRYGIGISGHPYDGVNEKRHEIFLTLSVPLQ